MNTRTHHNHRIVSRLGEIWSDITYAQQRMFEIDRAVQPRSTRRRSR